MVENNVVNMSSFREKRKGFMEGLKLKAEKPRKRKEGEIQVLDIDRSPIDIQDYQPKMGREVITKSQEDGQEEVSSQTQENREKEEPKKPIKRKEYKAKKSARRESHEEQRREARKKLRKKVRTIAAIAVSTISISAGVVAGGVLGEKLYNELEESRNAVTLEQALQAGKKLEEFSLQEDYVKILQDMNQMIEKENITYEELFDIAEEIPGLKQLFLKEKMVEAFKSLEDNKIDRKMNPAGIGMPKYLIADNIEFQADDSGEGVCIYVPGKGTYRSEKVSDYKTFSPDIEEYIEEFREAQRMRKAMEEKSVPMEDAKEFYEKAIKKINQQATWKIEIEDERKLEVEKMKQLELEMDDELEL